MKKIILKTICLLVFFVGLIGYSQSVAIASGTLIKVSNSEVVYVSGILSGRKKIPITAYTVDLLYGNQESVRIATNIKSSGGTFKFAGLVPENIKLKKPFKVKVTTNRQANNVFEIKKCICK